MMVRQLSRAADPSNTRNRGPHDHTSAFLTSRRYARRRFLDADRRRSSFLVARGPRGSRPVHPVARDGHLTPERKGSAFRRPHDRSRRAGGFGTESELLKRSNRKTPRHPRTSAQVRASAHTSAQGAAIRTGRATGKASPAAPDVPWWISVAVGGVALAVYVVMTPDVAGIKDSSEFTLVLATLGLAHPTGYPIYTMVGHVFVTLLHALGGSWPWAANVFSAVGGACAVGFLHAIAARLLTRAGLPSGAAAACAVIPAAAFGLNPVWTIEATLAEVNSWQVAWTCGAALVLIGAVSAF